MHGTAERRRPHETKRILAPRDQVRRDVRDRNDEVQAFSLDQIQHEPIEGLWRSVGRRIGDVAVAVPGRRRETDWPLRSNQHGDAAAAQRTGNRERRPLVAVGDEGLDVREMNTHYSYEANSVARTPGALARAASSISAASRVS